jgi:hypothetical protein
MSLDTTCPSTIFYRMLLNWASLRIALGTLPEDGNIMLKHVGLINWMNNWCICWFSHIFLLGILIFKGLTARHLYKLFGVKELIVLKFSPDLLFCNLFHVNYNTSTITEIPLPTTTWTTWRKENKNDVGVVLTHSKLRCRKQASSTVFKSYMQKSLLFTATTSY